MHLSFLLLAGIGGLRLEVGRLKDLGSFEHTGLDCVGGQLDLETPLLDFLALGNHGVEVADTLDAVVGLLEQ